MATISGRDSVKIYSYNFLSSPLITFICIHVHCSFKLIVLFPQIYLKIEFVVMITFMTTNLILK